MSPSCRGTRLAVPMLLGPIGVLRIAHPDGELAVARAASGLGVPMITSTAASFSIEEVAEANGTGPRWFQLYWPKDRGVAISLLKRAKAAGFSVLVGSLDALPVIVDAVGSESVVLFDGGVRGGADIIKAVALGARAVLIGRPHHYGLGLAGEDGVRHVLRSLRNDFEITMRLAGVAVLTVATGRRR